MTRSKYPAPAVLVAIFTVAVMAASTVARAGLSAADMNTIQSFKLTPKFLESYQAYDQDATQNPCDLSPLIYLMKTNGKSQSLDALSAGLDAQPGVHEALTRHRLTARDLLVGMMTLMSAAVQEQTEKNPDMVKSGEVKIEVAVSPENMAFYQQHKDEIRRHSTEVAREQLKRNGGKLPDCLNSGK